MDNILQHHTICHAMPGPETSNGFMNKKNIQPKLFFSFRLSLSRLWLSATECRLYGCYIVMNARKKESVYIAYIVLAPSKISWGGFYKTRRGISSPFLLLRKRKDVNVKYFLRNHFFLITTHYRHHHHNHIYIHTFLGADSFFSFPVHPLNL